MMGREQVKPRGTSKREGEEGGEGGESGDSREADDQPIPTSSATQNVEFTSMLLSL